VGIQSTVFSDRLQARVRLIALPKDDAAFEARVTAAVALVERDPHVTHGAVIRLLQELLPFYPELTIHQQEGLAALEAETSTWYVYRDGSLLRRSQSVAS
jgi:hypothetical protein